MLRSMFSVFIFFFLATAFVSHAEDKSLDMTETNKQKLLVTGCGRSGTTYMARLLEMSGYDIHHENKGSEGCVSWTMIVDYYSPWTPSNGESYEHIFHQVRHPLDVITSWYINLEDLDSVVWLLVRRSLPKIDRSDSLIVHCAKYWYYWNLLVETKAEWRYRIEDIETVKEEFASRSGIILSLLALDQVPKNSNSWKDISHRISWKELKASLPKKLYKKIAHMSLRYGYFY